MATIPELTAALERHGEAILSLPGVVGVAVGAGPPDTGPAIQVYLDPAGPEGSGAEARALLAPAPVEIVSMPPPQAEADSPSAAQ